MRPSPSVSFFLRAGFGVGSGAAAVAVGLAAGPDVTAVWEAGLDARCGTGVPAAFAAGEVDLEAAGVLAVAGVAGSVIYVPRSPSSVSLSTPAWEGSIPLSPSAPAWEDSLSLSPNGINSSMNPGRKPCQYATAPTMITTARSRTKIPQQHPRRPFIDSGSAPSGSHITS